MQVLKSAILLSLDKCMLLTPLFLNRRKVHKLKGNLLLLQRENYELTNLQTVLMLKNLSWTWQGCFDLTGQNKIILPLSTSWQQKLVHFSIWKQSFKFSFQYTASALLKFGWRVKLVSVNGVEMILNRQQICLCPDVCFCPDTHYALESCMLYISNLSSCNEVSKYNWSSDS